MLESKVSIIVPSYNVEKYIDECIQSLLRQTLVDIEIIIIDDCSTDETLNRIKSYNDRRLKLFKMETNQGQGLARNVGIEHAGGKYIGFMDGDDWASEDMYEKMYTYAEENSLEMVVCGLEVFFDGTDVRNDNIIPDGIRLDATHDAQFKCFASRIIRRDKMMELGLKFKKMYFEDVMLYADYFNKFKWFGLVHEPLYHYRRGHVSTAGDITSKKWMHFHRIQLEIYRRNPTIFQAESIISLLPERCKHAIEKGYFDDFRAFRDEAQESISPFQWDRVASNMDRGDRVILKALDAHTPEGVLSALVKARKITRMLRGV